MPGNAAAAVCMVLLVSIIHSARPTENCDERTSIPIADAQVFPNGSVWDPHGAVLYPPDAVKTEEDGIMYGCPCRLPDRFCLRKCCAMDQAMNFSSLNCEPHDAGDGWFRPNLTIDELGTSQVFHEEHFMFFHGINCSGYLLEPHIYLEDAHFFHSKNGSLMINGSSGSWLGPKDFCIEYLPDEDMYLPYVCFTNNKNSSTNYCDIVRYDIYPIGMVISILCLLASFVLYATKPKLLNLCGKCMLFYMASLLCAFVFLAIVQGLGEWLSENECVAFGFIIYFTMQCTFFWLNVLCIDITLSFRPKQSISGNPVQRDRKKLLFYSLYAWGMPVLLTIVTIAAEFHPLTEGTILQPSFRRACWFREDSTKMIFFTIPVALILFVNLGLFIYTAFNISKIDKRNEQCTDKKDKRRGVRKDKKRLRIYVTLSVVMGITWILEILSFMIGGSSCIWLFPDMINTLQGLWIFIILLYNWKGKCFIRYCRKLFSNKDQATRWADSDSSTNDEMDTSSESGEDYPVPENSMRMKSNAVKPSGDHSEPSPATEVGQITAC